VLLPFGVINDDDKYVSIGLGRSIKMRSVVCHKDLSISLFWLGNRKSGYCLLLGNIGSPNC